MLCFTVVEETRRGRQTDRARLIRVVVVLYRLINLIYRLALPISVHIDSTID
jgi:hypothetical protein